MSMSSGTEMQGCMRQAGVQPPVSAAGHLSPSPQPSRGIDGAGHLAVKAPAEDTMTSAQIYAAYVLQLSWASARRSLCSRRRRRRSVHVGPGLMEQVWAAVQLAISYDSQAPCQLDLRSTAAPAPPDRRLLNSSRRHAGPRPARWLLKRQNGEFVGIADASGPAGRRNRPANSLPQEASAAATCRAALGPSCGVKSSGSRRESPGTARGPTDLRRHRRRCRPPVLPSLVNCAPAGEL